MHVIKPVILLAKERAQFRFAAIASSIVQEAAASITQLVPMARSQNEQKTISGARDFLASRGAEFLENLKLKYATRLDRGMETMYRDLRPGLRNVSIDSLALIDEDTVARQMEVERRVLRLRDADLQSLTRLNLMIAQLHDESEIRERENPFRPYLMARSLHDALYEMTRTTDVLTMLFDHLSGALAEHLPEYFAAIRDVFESNGVQTRLTARPSIVTRRDREAMAAGHRHGERGASNNTVGEFTQTAMPPTNFQPTAFAQNAYSNTVFSHTAMQGMGNTILADGSPGPTVTVSVQVFERMLALLQPMHENQRPTLEPAPRTPQTALQDFVWKVFNQAAPGRVPPNPRYPDGAPSEPYSANDAIDKSLTQRPVFTRLNRVQKDLASVNSPAVAQDMARQLDLQNSLSNESLNEIERVAVDMVSTLFAYISNENGLLRSFRNIILQLQVPFMRCALLAPRLLHQSDHPARLLVNRMVTVGTGLSSSSPIGKGVREEMQRVADSILHNFDENPGIFEDALSHFNLAIERVLTSADEEAVRAISALKLGDAAFNGDPLQLQVSNALRERLNGVTTDPRVNEFILTTWARVLVVVEQRGDIDSQPYLAVVPDLIWSAQPVGQAERGRLMRLVLTLAQRIKSGLQLIGLPEEETRQVLDGLVELHAGALRPQASEPSKTVMSMTDLHRHFATMHLGILGDLDTPTIQTPGTSEEKLRSALRQLDVQAHLHFDGEIGTLLGTDTKWLIPLQPGAPVECWLHDTYQAATLLSVDTTQTFYLFRLADQVDPPRLLIYSSIALIKALREGSVCMAETAPIFDRAIESLLGGSA